MARKFIGTLDGSPVFADANTHTITCPRLNITAVYGNESPIDYINRNFRHFEPLDVVTIPVISAADAVYNYSDEHFAEFFVLLDKMLRERTADVSVPDADDMNNFITADFARRLSVILEEIIHDNDCNDGAWWKNQEV